MPGIVCAIRGGPASQPTIERAISLAREKEGTIHFLYVVNVDFLGRKSTSRIHTITRELQHMGDFILLKAQIDAQNEGVEAETYLREGKVGDEIIRLCSEIRADYVVLGRPAGEGAQDAFTRERQKQFVDSIKESSGAEAVFPEGNGQ